jgi:ribosomal protein S18 acetylase RimI-like enzyme
MSAFEMRRAAAADAAAVRALTRQAYAKWVAVTGREPKPMSADYDHAVQAHRIDLAYCEGALAGLIEMIPEADHLLVENVAVAPGFQKRGIGRRLMAHAEAVALGLDYAEVRLYTNKLFAENIALYRRLGYRIDREEPTERGIAVHMSKGVG